MITSLFRLLFLCTIVSCALHGQSVQMSQGRPAAVSDKLRQLGISLDKKSLVRALTNSDPWIRTLAAVQLGDEKAGDTLPSHCRR
jgi:hypothetical protein